MDKDRPVSLRLPTAMVEQLQARADKREEWDLSKEIRRALKLYLAKADGKRP